MNLNEKDNKRISLICNFAIEAQSARWGTSRNPLFGTRQHLKEVQV